MVLGKLLDLLPFGKIVSLAIDLAGQPVKGWLADVATRRAFENAVRHACRAFDARHPELTDEFFDETFIQHNVAPVLAEFLNTCGQLPTAVRVAEIWAETYHRTEAADRMTPYAAEFVENVAQQVMAQKLLRQYVTEGHLDRAVGLLDDIKQITIGLAEEDRRRELEMCLDRLWDATTFYRMVAELLSVQADRVAILRTRETTT